LCLLVKKEAMKNKILVTLLLLFLTGLIINKTYSQTSVGLRTSYIKHSNELGYLLKPTIGYEVTVGDWSFGDHFYYSGSVGVIFLNTRLDTLPTGSFNYSSTPTILTPGYSVYSNMTEFTFGVNFEYRFFDGPFRPLIGNDIYVSLLEMDYVSYIPGGGTKSSQNEITGLYTIYPRIGAIYEINESFSAQAGFGKMIGFDHRFDKYQYWKIYIGLSFTFGG